jgi:hypothetical protein
MRPLAARGAFCCESLLMMEDMGAFRPIVKETTKFLFSAGKTMIRENT